ncbi:MAG: hypothetical protein WA354_07870 [Terracidiphilus sp.]
MSYDLMVFEPDAVPAGHAEFVHWCVQRTKWSEDHGYDDPALSSEHLRAWFEDIIRIFPPMNGPSAGVQVPEDEASSTDYAIGEDFIYASFAWSKAEQAYMTVARLAEKHQLGLFNASSSGEEVWIPKDGRMTLVHDKRPTGVLGRILNLLKLSK